ncbi:MAG: hypothetical protein ABS76_37025 [Pelagibacterium sp. SCN 64-44]|nr:MAG: hypothetical protein ABS76_37025 [Pelagibacterium sp. SCN 64-44]
MDPIRVAGEFMVESHNRGTQRHPELAAVQGGFVVAWTDDAVPFCEVGGPDVRAKVFSWTGDTLVREFLVNSETIDHQRDAKIAGVADGGYVLVWQDFSGRGGDDSGGIKAKIFDGQHRLVRDEFLVNSDTEDRQFNAYVAALDGDDFVVPGRPVTAAPLASRRACLRRTDGRAAPSSLSATIRKDGKITLWWLP